MNQLQLFGYLFLFWWLVNLIERYAIPAIAKLKCPIWLRITIVVVECTGLFYAVWWFSGYIIGFDNETPTD